MKAEIHQTVEVCKALGGAIHAMKTVPEGLLYATVMSTMSLDYFKQCVGLLIKTGLVTKDSQHVLHWIGEVQL